MLGKLAAAGVLCFLLFWSLYGLYLVVHLVWLAYGRPDVAEIDATTWVARLITLSHSVPAKVAEPAGSVIFGLALAAMAQQRANFATATSWIFAFLLVLAAAGSILTVMYIGNVNPAMTHGGLLVINLVASLNETGLQLSLLLLGALIGVKFFPEARSET